MTIQYYTKMVYGVPLEYIANAELSKIFHEITGKKSMNEYARKQFEKLGVQFKEVIQPK